MNDQGQSLRLSPDALLLATLVGCYVALKSILPLPQLVPFQPPWTFLVLLGVGAYCLIDFLPDRYGPDVRARALLKWTLVAGVVAIIVVAPLTLATVLRKATAPYKYVHDGLVQSELATDLVLQGKNPYVEDYFGTPLESWPFQEGDLRINPALQHYPYLPLTFLVPLPFQKLAENSIGWFDQRWVHLIFFIGVLILGTALASDPSRRMFLLQVLGLNPLFVVFLIEGRNDVLTLFWILLTVVLLQRKRFVLSAISLALACGTKQFAWFFVPFFLLYVSGSGSWRARARRLIRPLSVFSIVFAAIILPWLVWDSRAFMEDVLGFQSGMIAGGYPVAGLGLSTALATIDSLRAAVGNFPFWALQAAIGLPLVAFLLRRLSNRSSLSLTLSSYAISLAVILFVSRAFNDNYIGYLVAIMAVASLMDDQSESRPEAVR